ncbi:MAG: caspase family protein [Treponema sp.]|nr:caspase family protein [Treponema sp.]MCL2238160.1 caspase family protein [Treponema sp.]
MKQNRLIFGIVCVIIANFAVNSLFAEDPGRPTRRFGVFIGSNSGGLERDMLNFTVNDARYIQNAVVEMRIVDRADSFLISEPNIGEIDARFDELYQLVTAAKAVNMRTEIIFYYSGHSDEEGLMINREKYKFGDLRERLTGIPADMHIVIMDVCASRAYSAVRGGGRNYPFAADGFVFLTSISENETVKESNRIEASLYTHSLITGLRGVADFDGDGHVTISELNRFVNAESLVRPELALLGIQRSSFDIQTRGPGGHVLTDVTRITVGIIFDADLIGRISIRNSHNLLVADFNKTERLIEMGLVPGRYRLTMEHNEKYLFAEVTLTQRNRAQISLADFTALDPEDNVTIYTFFYNETYEPFPFPTIGFINRAVGDHRDIQIGLVNLTTENLTGFQAAFFNMTGGGFTGFQSGFINAVGLDFNGFQSGFINSNGNTSGFQAGFVNTNFGNTNGFQAGFVNVSAKIMTGIQVGFFNYAESYESGIPIGVINIIENGGYRSVEYSISNFSIFNLSFKLGLERFYTIFAASYEDAGDFTWENISVGLGFGSIIPLLGSFLCINPEFTHFYPLSQDTSYNYNTLGLYLGVAIWKFSIAIGPTLTWVHSPGWFGDKEPLGATSQFFNFYETDIDPYNRLIVGAKIALRFTF